MRILVTYASRHGATKGIAERIGDRLRDHGLETEVAPVEIIDDVAGYDAFVIGSAAYMGHWLKDASAFVRRHAAELAATPVWLFSSGPVGSEPVDAKGHDVVEASIPLEFPELVDMLRPRDARIFFGAWDPEYRPIGLMERLGRPFLRMPAVREALPAGDFRDWPAIDAWADGIAAALRPEVPVAAGVGG